ncbi:MAG: hypothetical protein WB995_03150 [Candidatus Acidiferrales bacterium]
MTPFRAAIRMTAFRSWPDRWFVADSLPVGKANGREERGIPHPVMRVWDDGDWGVSAYFVRGAIVREEAGKTRGRYQWNCNGDGNFKFSI